MTKETRSKQINVWITPSIFSDLKKVAHMTEKSANQMIFEMLENYLGSEHSQELIKTYNQVFLKKKEE